MESIAADDDFEFHNTKDHGEEIQFTMTPNERKGMEYYSHYNIYHNSPQDTMSSQATTASAHSDTINKKSWDNLFKADNSHLSENKLIDSSTYRIHHSVPSKKLIYLKHHKSPRKFISHINSLSMNDLDCINNGSSHKNSEEIMYILPVRSDSRLSLYQIHIEENENESKGLTKAVSEGNLNFHSDQNVRKELCVKPFIKDSFEKHSRFSARGMTAKKILKQVQRKELERAYLQNLPPEVQSSQENQINFNRKSINGNNINPALLNKSNYKNKPDIIHKNNISNNSLNVSDCSKYSYFDNGDVCWHDVIDEHEGDIKKIFVSDYL